VFLEWNFITTIYVYGGDNKIIFLIKYENVNVYVMMFRTRPMDTIRKQMYKMGNYYNYFEYEQGQSKINNFQRTIFQFLIGVCDIKL